MTEGLRVLPYIQAAREDDPEFGTYDDCARCERHNSPELRRDMGCGLLSPSPTPPRSIMLSDKIPDLTGCPVYAALLPDVVDVAWVWPHYDKGQLALALGDLEPSRSLMDGLRMLSSAITEQTVSAHKERSQAAGGRP